MARKKNGQSHESHSQLQSWEVMRLAADKCHSALEQDRIVGEP